MVFIPQAQPHAQSLFLFPIVFGINLIHFFDFFGEKGRREGRIEKVRIFGKGKCKLIANCANFWQGKV